MTMRSDRSRRPPGSRAPFLRRRLLSGIVVLGLAAAPALAATPAHAQAAPDKQAEAAAVADKLDALNQSLARLNSEYESANFALSKAQADVSDAQTRVDTANAELAQRREELRRFSIQAYVTGNDDPGFEALVTSTGDVAPQKRGYLEIASGSRQDLLERVEATKAKAETETAKLAAAVAEAQQYTAQVEASKSEAQKSVDEQARIKSKIDGELTSLVAAEQQRRADDAAAKAAQQVSVLSTASTTPGNSGGGGGAGGTGTGGDQGGTTPAPRVNQPTPVPTPTPAPPAPTAPAPAPPAPTVPVGPQRGNAGAAIAAAYSKIGSPYVWAAAGPNAFDCSGFTMWAWAQAGVGLAHYTGAQWAMTRHISLAEAQPGDLIFDWGPGTGGDPGHVGLYLGGGMMIHAPSAGNYVRVDSIYWWTGARVAAGRI